MNNPSRSPLHQITMIGIMRNISFDDAIQLLPLYEKAGFSHLEITMNSPDADAQIQHAVSNYGDVLHIGAGTVCSMSDLERALRSGAGFIVTPVLNEEVIRACTGMGIPVYPGAYTPTEIYKAWNLGAEMVKVFPASVAGPSFIRNVKVAMNSIKLLPTGGINLQNIDSFIEAGADGLGIGSPLFDRHYIQTRNWDALKKHFEAFAGRLSAVHPTGKKQEDASKNN